MSTNSQTHEINEIRNENAATKVSVGVGRETTSIVSPKQKPISTTVGDECVSY
jgi:hypothetical protein